MDLRPHCPLVVSMRDLSTLWMHQQETWQVTACFKLRMNHVRSVQLMFCCFKLHFCPRRPLRDVSAYTFARRPRSTGISLNVYCQPLENNIRKRRIKPVIQSDIVQIECVLRPVHTVTLHVVGEQMMVYSMMMENAMENGTWKMPTKEERYIYFCTA